MNITGERISIKLLAVRKRFFKFALVFNLICFSAKLITLLAKFPIINEDKNPTLLRRALKRRKLSIMAVECGSLCEACQKNHFVLRGSVTIFCCPGFSISAVPALVASSPFSGVSLKPKASLASGIPAILF